MHFRLVYDGPLLAHRDGERLPERSLHVHDIRRKFHSQLKTLWKTHPILQNTEYNKTGVIGAQAIQDFDREGFMWRPIVNESNGLICALDILMLRDGRPGKAIHDIDNRLKTIFDALRMPKGPDELGQGTSKGRQLPREDERPFFVVLEDDKLITHLAVTTDALLDPVRDVPIADAVRLVIGVTIRPYHVHMENIVFS